MKRVLIANKFYYNRGGDCIASISLEQLLKNRGHEVAFFSMNHPQNYPSDWTSFFPSQVDFQSKGLIAKLQAASRIFHSKEVEQKFTQLIQSFKPDILHLNNIHSQLSPLIGEIAHKQGIKVVWTLHDYKLICPNYTCLSYGKICESCLHAGVSHVWKKRCMKGNLPASILAYFEASYWHKERLIKQTDCFISPSSFLASKMKEGGFPSHKIQVLPNFSSRALPIERGTKQNYFCYVGRLSHEKGLITLIHAAQQSSYPLVIVGTGPLEEELKRLCDRNDLISFVGYKEWNELHRIISQARFMVVPSEWYENNPLSIIEAHSLGTPVLGANIGGIPELINAQNGMLFEAGNTGDLQEKIQQMFDREFNYSDICSSAREKYSAERYYNKLMEIYEQ